MRRAPFALVILVSALGLGSWLGLGRPSAEEARDLPATLAARARSGNLGATLPFRIGQGPAPAERTEKTPEPATGELPPSPLERDPSLLPDKRDAWRALNDGASVQRAWMVAEGPEKAPGENRRLVTLTFDDGPSKATPEVLRLLARHRVHATFFVIGGYLDGDSPRAESAKRTLKKVAAAGHLIGNHTYDHQRLTSVSRTQALDEIDQSAAAIERVLGSRPTLFRPPFGALDAFGENAVRERGLSLVLWSVEKADMKRDDDAEMFHDLVAQLDYKEGGIVLLHDVRKSSVRVLARLLDWLAVRKWDPKRPSRVGYQIVDLPTYMKEVAAHPLPFESRDELEKVRRAKKHPERKLTPRGDEPADG